MSGAHRLQVSEMTLKNKNSRDEKYLNDVEDEMVKENAANEGSSEDNADTSDKLFPEHRIGK